MYKSELGVLLKTSFGLQYECYLEKMNIAIKSCEQWYTCTVV